MQDITLTLDHTGFAIVLRGFVPHGVSVEFQKQLFKGIKGNLADLQPTKQNLLDHFGADTIEKMDSMEQDKYDEEFKRLSGEYLVSNLDMGENGFDDITKSNDLLVVGMIRLWKGKELSQDELRKAIFELPEPDFLQIVHKVTEIQKRPLVLKKSQTSENSSKDSRTSGQSSK